VIVLSMIARPALSDSAQDCNDKAMGQLVKTDPSRWIESCQALANEGDPEGQLLLGLSYEAGWGVTRDSSEAIKWYRKAADQGCAAAQAVLGAIYSSQVRGAPQNYAEAFKWDLMAAKQGNASSQFYLAQEYEDGEGVTQNFVEAAKWYRKASDQGYGPAQLFLSRMYYNGNGVERDLVLAYFWAKLATQQGVMQPDKLNMLATEMTQQQVNEAQQSAAQWTPTPSLWDPRKESTCAHR
jgi:TPR repeat protein